MPEIIFFNIFSIFLLVLFCLFLSCFHRILYANSSYEMHQPCLIKKSELIFGKHCNCRDIYIVYWNSVATLLPLRPKNLTLTSKDIKVFSCGPFIVFKLIYLCNCILNPFLCNTLYSPIDLFIYMFNIIFMINCLFKCNK